MQFVKSVAEGNSQYARELFTDEAVLFGYLDGKLEHGSIEQFYHNVDTVAAGENFKARGRRPPPGGDPGGGPGPGGGLGRPHRLYRRPAPAEDGRPVEVRGQGL